ncbi:MAG: short-chain dehydrogenase, partial [Mariprofundaceae bacterium]|nr:short-chain dehydrogenase [Mariprofundaceae bacterium]
SVAGMSRVIERVDEYEAGSFIAFDGKVVPY